MNKTKKFSVILLASCILVACGGGSSVVQTPHN